MFYLIIPKQHRWGEVGSQHSLPCLSSFTCAAPLLCRGACVLSFSTLFGNYHILLLFLLVAPKLLCWVSIGHKPLKQIHCIVLRTWTNKLTWSWSDSFNLPVVALWWLSVLLGGHNCGRFQPDSPSWLSATLSGATSLHRIPNSTKTTGSQVVTTQPSKPSRVRSDTGQSI